LKQTHPTCDSCGHVVEYNDDEEEARTMNFILDSYEVKTTQLNITIVRLKTTAWTDKRGIHEKRSLTFLRRMCEGHNPLEEDILCVGAHEALQMITNFNECDDGIYSVDIVNETCDYESGQIDDWEYKLVPIEEDK